MNTLNNTKRVNLLNDSMLNHTFKEYNKLNKIYKKDELHKRNITMVFEGPELFTKEVDIENYLETLKT